MRKRLLFLLLLAFVLSPRPASADPLRILSGMFALDIEGDMFTFDGRGFSLTTAGPDGLSPVHPDGLGIYATKQFTESAPFTGWPPSDGFNGHAAVGERIDWSFQTVGGEQLLGRGNAVLGGVNATNVDFIGSMRFNTAPTPFLPGDVLDFDFVVPFSFEATIRGVQGGQELFARQFIGTGLVSVNYEANPLRPGIYDNDNETIRYRFTEAAAPVPEPGTLLLLGSGLAGAALRRRRRET